MGERGGYPFQKKVFYGKKFNSDQPVFFRGKGSKNSSISML